MKNKREKVKKEKKKLSKKKRAVICLCVAVALAVAGVTGYAVSQRILYPKIKAKKTVRLSSMVKDTEGITLIAHRGLSAIAPENTLPAFEKAGEAKFYGAECDVHITSDSTWVIMHDSNTRKMCGVRKTIARTSFTELEKLNITNGANIENYYTVKIPTLQSYLDICYEYSLVPVIEIKCSDTSKRTMKNLYSAVSSTEAGKSAIYISFYKKSLENIRAIDSEAVCWLLVNELKNEDIDYCKQQGFGIDFNANNDKLTDETVKYAVNSGVTVSCWTVDSKETLTRMHTLGVNIFTTNRILPEV